MCVSCLNCWLDSGPRIEPEIVAKFLLSEFGKANADAKALQPNSVFDLLQRQDPAPEAPEAQLFRGGGLLRVRRAALVHCGSGQCRRGDVASLASSILVLSLQLWAREGLASKYCRMMCQRSWAFFFGRKYGKMGPSSNCCCDHHGWESCSSNVFC